MKKLIKGVLRRIWNRTEARRARFLHETHLFLHRTVVVPTVMGTETPDRITNLDRRLDVLTHRMELIQHDLNLTLNDLVREVIRLQNQIEELQIGWEGSRSEEPMGEYGEDRRVRRAS